MSEGCDNENVDNSVRSDKSPLLSSESVNSVPYGRPEKSSTYEEAIAATGYGWFHLCVLVLCGWAVSSDAIEVLSVSFMLPSATCDLGLSSTDKGTLNSIIFLGMMVGGYFWGSLADRLGRRAVLLGSLTVNGLGGLASSTAQVFWLFLLLRFVSGVGVGGSMPVIFSYFTEFQPLNRRGMMISVLATFWMFGNVIAAGLAWIIIPQSIGIVTSGFSYNSWRIFIAVCTIPSLTSAAIFVLMPESPKFLLESGKEDEALAVLRKIHKLNKPKSNPTFEITSLSLVASADEDDRYREIHVEKHSRHPRQRMGCVRSVCVELIQILLQTRKLFRKPFLWNTITILIINFTLSFGYYGLWMWFPELFSRVEKYGGSPCDQTNAVLNVTTPTNFSCERPDNWVYFSGFMTALSNVPGNVLSIFLMDRLGRKSLLACSMVVSGACVFLIVFVHNKIQNLLISCLFGAVSTIGWSALDVLAAELFPTAVRSTAFGVQSVVGRCGAILGNILFGTLVEVHCIVPMLLVAALLTFGGLSAIRLPNTTKTDIH